jgi:hypothetical protein
MRFEGNMGQLMQTEKNTKVFHLPIVYVQSHPEV